MTDALLAMNVADIPVVILAGGRGARFDHESQVLPKPLIQVAGRPIIRHIMDSLYQQGFRKFVIACGYLGDRIAAYFQPMSTLTYQTTKIISLHPGREQNGFEAPGLPNDIGIWIVDTGDDSHTGKRLGLLRRQGFLDRSFVLTYGDGLSNVDMRDVIAHHEHYSLPQYRERKFVEPYVTMTVVNPPGRFGVIKFFDGMPDGLVQTFGEKPTQDWINGGFMYVDPTFVDEYVIDEEEYNQLEGKALFDCSLARRMLAYRHIGYWQCMDTRRDLEKIEEDVKELGDLPWMIVDQGW